jgi:hypothetical protein
LLALALLLLSCLDLLARIPALLLRLREQTRLL